LVIRNPFAGRFVDDLRPLFEAGAMLGERLMPELVKLLGGRLMPELVKLLGGRPSPMVRARSSASTARRSTAARAFIRCLETRCGQQSVAVRR
jgi:Amino acid synthesis